MIVDVCIAMTCLYHFPYQRTPLHVAAYHGRKEVVEYLVQKGADTNIEDINGVSNSKLELLMGVHFLACEKGLCVPNIYGHSCHPKHTPSTAYIAISKDVHIHIHILSFPDQ